MEGKIQTIEDLAILIQNTMASKEDIKELRTDMQAMEDRLTMRLDRIEHLLLAKQEQRLNELEARMKKLEDALAV